MQQAFSKAREISHAAIAIIGAASASVALIVSVLVFIGVHVTNEQAIQVLGVAGGIAVLISKGIDSLNNAVTTGSKPAA